MKVGHRAIAWNRQKFFYDGAVLLMALLGAVAFVFVSRMLGPQFPMDLLLLRGSAFLGLFLLQALLCLGPLARLNPRFLPLLYNRRHLGIAVFIAAAIHGATVLIRNFGGIGVPAMTRVFTGYAHEYSNAALQPQEIHRIPFEPFGAVALFVLAILAATSHDFWPRFLGLRVWKALHVLLYPAYGLVLLHVGFGLLQAESSLVYPVMVGVGALFVFGIHFAAVFWGPPRYLSRAPKPGTGEGFIPVCRVADLAEQQGRSAIVGNAPIALFRNGGRAYAIAGGCPHQGGPLGEGHIVDGLVTCPWHGHQFHLESGACVAGNCPRIATYPIRVEGDRVLVGPEPNPGGTEYLGAPLTGGASRLDPAALREAGARFYVGHRGFQSESELTFTLVAALALVMLCPLYMAAAAFAQSPPDAGTALGGTTITYTGVYSAKPFPSVYVLPESAGSQDLPGYPMLLSGADGGGVPVSWQDCDGMKIRFEASPVYRGNIVLLELSSGLPPEVLGQPSGNEGPAAARATRAATLTGELVNTACYLGAHRPGAGKLHRACAIRCLSVGALPAVRIQTEVRESIVVIATPDDWSQEYILPYAGREVIVRGQVYRTSGFMYILAESVDLSRD